MLMRATESGIPTKGICVATCCFDRITAEGYCNPTFLIQSLGLMRATNLSDPTSLISATFIPDLEPTSSQAIEAKALVRASKYSPLSQAQLALGNDTSEEPVARHACAHGENVNDDAKRAAIDPEALRLVVRCASWTNRLSRGTVDVGTQTEIDVSINTALFRLGQLVCSLFDHGRALYLQECGFSTSRRAYVGSQVTPYNHVLLAKPI